MLSAALLVSPLLGTAHAFEGAMASLELSAEVIKRAFSSEIENCRYPAI
jgi:hypothetical protein